MSPSKASSDLTFHPLTPQRWNDLEDLFGRQGACGGCWCMWWRLTQAEFNRRKGPGNKQAMKKIVRSGLVPGILAYAQGRPVGWCSIGPREVYPRLERSRILQRVDDQPVWSAVCFFVARSYRRRGVTIGLLSAAVEYARKKGAKIVEGYPVEPRKKQAPDVFLYHGLASAFRQAGFKEVVRRSQTRPIMRLNI